MRLMCSEYVSCCLTLLVNTHFQYIETTREQSFKHLRSGVSALWSKVGAEGGVVGESLSRNQICPYWNPRTCSLLSPCQTGAGDGAEYEVELH